jgi:hypothetical protein
MNLSTSTRKREGTDMNDVSTLRLYLLRATYLFVVLGLGVTIWPLILNVPPDLERMKGVVRSVLTAVSLLAIIGIRYPLQMLPLMFFELVWKLIWMLAIGLPAWSAGGMDEGMQGTFEDCLIGVVLFLIVIPWRYVYAHYIRRPGDRWK